MARLTAQDRRALRDLLARLGPRRLALALARECEAVAATLDDAAKRRLLAEARAFEEAPSSPTTATDAPSSAPPAPARAPRLRRRAPGALAPRDPRVVVGHVRRMAPGPDGTRPMLTLPDPSGVMRGDFDADEITAAFLVKHWGPGVYQVDWFERTEHGRLKGRGRGQRVEVFDPKAPAQPAAPVVAPQAPAPVDPAAMFALMQLSMMQAQTNAAHQAALDELAANERAARDELAARERAARERLARAEAGLALDAAPVVLAAAPPSDAPTVTVAPTVRPPRKERPLAPAARPAPPVPAPVTARVPPSRTPDAPPRANDAEPAPRRAAEAEPSGIADALARELPAPKKPPGSTPASAVLAWDLPRASSG